MPLAPRPTDPPAEAGDWRARRGCRRLVGLLVMSAAAIFGLASRWTVLSGWPIVGPYGGDAAWTIAAAGGLRVLLPGLTGVRIALLAYGLSVGVELSQLVHTEWLDAIRGHRIGALLLGRGFLWSDLVAYAAGAVLSGLIDRAVLGPTAPRS